ncbi:hypothetical protein [Actinoplanes derwentensis]|uniref:Uncharacterized protein n=1 Tax=Actinoplanes derwentensis TaxID=113562 RepID=A0A1H1TL24_9ACTN|nr:hypothetical protein [Actinoplanes derwentensis]GID85062.1 hypothetical protein Ade03nite_39860 [Actinoplanes derwentensis]SDS60874.1 hypothetical protein SAMN04489716_1170 [Actinoplanes derwentensis]
MDDGQLPTELRIAGYIKPVGRHRNHSEQPRIAWPEISDYWPDAPPQSNWQGLLPPNAYSVAHDDQPTELRGRPWSQRPVILTGMTALLVVFGTVLLARPLAISEVTDRPVAAPTDVIPLEPLPVASPSPSFSFSLPPTTTAVAASPSQTSPPATIKRARLEFVSGVTVLSVRIMDLDGENYQVTSASGAPVDADVTFSGGVLRVDVKPGGADAGEVEIRLSRSIIWHLRLGAGVKTLNFNSIAGTVSRIDLDGGAESMNLVLGRLAGVVPIRMTGGVGTWTISTATRVPTRVFIRAGAGNVTLYGRANGGTAPETVLGTTNLTTGPALDIDATGGIGSLEVNRS